MAEILVHWATSTDGYHDSKAKTGAGILAGHPSSGEKSSFPVTVKKKLPQVRFILKKM